MTGLIYKDFLALKGHLTTYLVFFLVYGGLCLSGDNQIMEMVFCYQHLY